MPDMALDKDKPPPFELLLKSKEEMRQTFTAFIKRTFAENTNSAYQKMFAECENECWEACRFNDLRLISDSFRNRSLIKNHFSNFLKTVAVKESHKYPRLQPDFSARPPKIRGLTPSAAHLVGDIYMVPSQESIGLISSIDKGGFVAATWHVRDETVQFNIPKRILLSSASGDGFHSPSDLKVFCSCLKGDWCEHQVVALTTLVDSDAFATSSDAASTARSKNGEVSDSSASCAQGKPIGADNSTLIDETNRLLRVLHTLDSKTIVRELQRVVLTEDGLHAVAAMFPAHKYPATIVETCKKCYKKFVRGRESDRCCMPHPLEFVERLDDRDGRSRYYCVKCQKSWDDPIGAFASEGGHCYEGPHE
jgi:hypothetical protein